MNLKDLLVPFALALLVTWVIHNLFLSKFTGDTQEGIRSGQTFTAPLTHEVKPLNTEVDFIDTPITTPAVATTVETEYAQLQFSSYGAILDQLLFKRGKQGDIAMVLPEGDMQRENSCFLVALQNNTPYLYQLANTEETDEAFHLTYQSSGPVSITKTFVVYKKMYQIDMQLDLQINSGMTVQPRILFTSPLMKDPIKYDTLSAIFNKEGGSVGKVAFDKVDTRKGWFAPSLFGAENKYFIYSLVKDPDHFVQRAYYKQFGQDQLCSFLEGPVVDKSMQWNCSFYFGPKDRRAVMEVDPRLEETFDYSGLLAPLSRLLLMLLSFFFTYLHNYGLAIIGITILVKLLLLPFTFKSEQSLNKGRDIQKKLAYLQKKYKNDPEVLAREKAELIKKHGMPGMGGCLTLFLQIPIFFALNRILNSSFELYNAHFLWISDLAAPDPYYILSLSMSLGIIITALLGDAKQRPMMLGFGLVSFALFANFAAGLALYISVSTGLGLLQTTLMRKMKKV